MVPPQKVVILSAASLQSMPAGALDLGGEVERADVVAAQALALATGLHAARAIEHDQHVGDDRAGGEAGATAVAARPAPASLPGDVTSLPGSLAGVLLLVPLPASVLARVPLDAAASAVALLTFSLREGAGTGEGLIAGAARGRQQQPSTTHLPTPSAAHVLHSYATSSLVGAKSGVSALRSHGAGATRAGDDKGHLPDTRQLLGEPAL